MTEASKVWMPDTFFRNEKIGRFHSILTPNLYVRVFPGGDVLYSIRRGWLILTKGGFLTLLTLKPSIAEEPQGNNFNTKGQYFDAQTFSNFIKMC